MFCNKTMFRYAKNVRLVSFLQQAFQMALTGFLPVSLWLSMALCDSHSGSHWLSLPLSGILWPSLAHYCSLISRIQPLIGSQGPCSALIADATMTHFLPLCRCPAFGIQRPSNKDKIPLSLAPQAIIRPSTCRVLKTGETFLL